jgi:hypothetical protein
LTAAAAAANIQSEAMMQKMLGDVEAGGGSDRS